MSYSVYIIECRDKTLYVGHTHNLSQRLSHHAKGIGSHHVAQRGFLRLIYSEHLPDEASAIRREMQIKRWSRAKKKALAQGDTTKLRALSQSRLT